MTGWPDTTRALIGQRLKSHSGSQRTRRRNWLVVKKIDICMVSSLTMTKLCKDPGTPAFVISMADLIPSQATATNTLDSILAEYCDFCNVFSGEKAGTLAPHRPYDLQINVEEGAKPFHGPIYSLSPPQLKALQQFLEEH